MDRFSPLARVLLIGILFGSPQWIRAQANSNLGFGAPVTYGTGSGPFSVIVGDFNGDGKADIASANYYSNNVSVLLGNGNGTFQAAQTFAAGAGAYAIATGDFNGDGKADLAVANYGAGNVSVLLGNGDGTFNAAISYAVGSGPNSITVADFNGDGKADLAIGNYLDNNVSVLMGNGNGTFQSPRTLPAGPFPTATAAGDLNGDGKTDLVVANSGSDTGNAGNVSVFLGKGDGTFQPAISYAAGADPFAIAIADFNLDGVQDLAVANFIDGTVSILLGLGGGNFSSAVTYDAGNGSYWVSAGDFNGDGRPDLAVVNTLDNTVSVHFAAAGGIFQPAVTYAVGNAPAGLAVGDFNGDGQLDLAIANSADANIGVLLTSGSPSNTITVTAGSGQSAPVNTTFSAALQAKVTDSAGNGVVGVSVTFTAPSSGASGTFAASGLTAAAQTNSAGVAAAPAFTANATAGSYSVTAAAAGVAGSAKFTMTNTVVTVLSISGQVTSSGAPLTGVVVTLTGGAGGTRSTDALGNYSFTGLNAGVNYTVTPSLASNSFTPANISFNNPQSSQTANFIANSPAPPTADSVSPSSGSGSSQTFTFKYSSGNGYGNLNLIQGLINTAIDGSGACYFQYYTASSRLYLFNDTGSGYAAQSLTPGLQATASNSQCTISGIGFTVTGSGNQLTLAIPVSFTGSFAGLKSIYGYASDQGNLNTGWKKLGTWTTNGAVTATPPTADSVSPASGSGSSQTFTFKYSSINGYSNLSLVQGLINTSVNAAAACNFQYSPASTTLYLINDAGSGNVAQSLTPGQSASASNSQCTISGAGFIATGSGSQLTLAVPVTFTNAFAGLKSIYGYAADQGNLNSGWKTLGTWTTSGAVTATPPTADSVSPASGTGSSQTFTFKYSSINGYGSLSLVQGLINTSVNGTAACNFQFYPASATLYLINDAGTGNVAQSLTPGQSASASNNQCTVSGAGFTATGTGSQLTLAVPVTFTGAFAGLKSIYGYAVDQGNLNSGWKTLGTWTISGAVNTTPPTADSVSPASGTGSSQTFTFKYSSVNGYGSLSLVQGLINTSVNGTAACNFQYYPASTTLYLANDAGTGNVAQTLTPGQSASTSNSQCTISGAGFTATGSGSQLTLAVPVTFTGAFAGLKSIYGYAVDQGNLNSGWKTLGTWTTNATANSAPTADSVSPASGSGSSQTFTFKYSSGNGYGYLNLIQGLINTAIDGSGACYFQYYSASSRLYLFSDTGSGFAAQSLTPGLSATASNSQCTINGSGFTVIGSGNQLTLAIPVTFTGSFAGLKSIYGYAGDQGNLNSGWKTLGTWTTSGAVTTPPPTADSVSPASGSGYIQTFTYKYSSANGYGSLNLVQGLINASVNGTAGACYFQYYPASTTLYLINDAGSGNAAQSLTPGQSATANNSQCTISGAGFTATGSGSQLSLAIPVTFTAAFAGLKSIYGYAADQSNLNSGWKTLGTWTINGAVNTTPPTADSVSPASGTGSSQTFTFKYSSVSGFGNLSLVQGLINSSVNAASACNFQYYPASTTLYLINDAGTGNVAQALTPGQSASASNSQCTISGSGFTASGSGSQLTLAIPVTFTGAFAGSKSIYGYASDQTNLNSGWTTLGTWTIIGAINTTPPTADSVSPASGSGTSQTFTFKYSSGNGYGNLRSIQGLINTSVDGMGACYFQYYQASNTLYLFNDPGSGFATQSLTPAQPASATNSQCTISGAGFTVAGSGNQLTLAIPIAFSGSFAGSKNVYGYVDDKGGQNSGWVKLGSWLR